MGFIIVRKARGAVDFLKFQVLFSNPLSRSVVAEILEREDGKLRAERLLDSYPEMPEGLSWITSRTCRGILESLRLAFGDSTEKFSASLKRPDIRRTVLNFLLSVRDYGLQRPQRFYAPLMVVWNLTRRCNLRCKHCYETAGPLRHGADDELELDEKLEVIDQLAESYVPTLSFSGGEPLSHPHFWPVAEAAREKGLYLSLNTNGTLITPEVAARLAKLDFAYAGVSLDSAFRDQHDEFRGVTGSWDRTVEGIRHLADHSVDTILSFTVTNRNYTQLPAMFRLAEELKMSKVMVYNFVPTGRGRENLQYDLTAEQREEALDMIYEYSESGGSVCSTAPQYGRKCAEMGHPELTPLAHTGSGKAKSLQILAEIVGGCGVGRAYLALQPDGVVTPCVYMPDVRIGSIREDSLLNIWKNSDLLASLAAHEDLKGNCGVCEHRAVCGGCRARAYAYFGDFKGPDPGCIKNAAFCDQHAPCTGSQANRVPISPLSP